ncbi:MAG TPA: thiamine pyrophosphate-dependent enzyme, partial [Solirubrobacteraceae bacterium]|nr:thiamine pyrophosphate-dependent enzyme [Solirubrobacteraceae bacterium]
PEDYRSKEEVAEWRERDPIPAFGDVLEREGLLTAEQRARIESDAMRRVDEAVEFAEASPFPDPDTLYEDVYVIDEHVHGHYHEAALDPAWQASSVQPPAGQTTPAGQASAAQPDGTREDMG